LTETGPNTGIFQTSFSFTSSESSASASSIQVKPGDNIGISYDSTHPRATVDIGGVQQGGNVELTQVPEIDDKPSVLIGGAVQVTFADDVILSPNAQTEIINTQCNDFGIPPEDCPSGVAAGETTISMSYANAPLNGQDPHAFTIWQNVPGTGWVDLAAYQPSGSTIQIDTTTETVTAYTPFKGGIFVIGVPESGGGGGGGGIGLPGAGIVLDLLAPVTAESPETPNPPDESQGSSSTSAPTDSTNSTTNPANQGSSEISGQPQQQATNGT
jgi:hypothetical protein